MIRVDRLQPSDAPAVVDVLCEAFYDYPVMRWVLGEEHPDYDEAIRTLVNVFVQARALRGEYLLGIGGETLDAAAIVSRPDGPPSPPAFHALRASAWATLGGSAEARYTAFGEATAPFTVDAPHLHLNMVGTRNAARGRGLGRSLLEAVHDLSASDPHSVGVTLSTENPANVSLYRHFGYGVLGHARISPDLETWSFFRPDSAASVR